MSKKEVFIILKTKWLCTENKATVIADLWAAIFLVPPSRHARFSNFSYFLSPKNYKLHFCSRQKKTY